MDHWPDISMNTVWQWICMIHVSWREMQCVLSQMFPFFKLCMHPVQHTIIQRVNICQYCDSPQELHVLYEGIHVDDCGGERWREMLQQQNSLSGESWDHAQQNDHLSWYWRLFGSIQTTTDDLVQGTVRCHNLNKCCLLKCGLWQSALCQECERVEWRSSITVNTTHIWIPEVEEEDGGNYTCELQYGSRLVRRTTQLKVTGTVDGWMEGSVHAWSLGTFVGFWRCYLEHCRQVLVHRTNVAQAMTQSGFY